MRHLFYEKVCDAIMQTIRFSVHSVSHAMRGQRLLASAGIRSAVRRREVDPATGCGYRLELLDAAQDRVLDVGVVEDYSGVEGPDEGHEITGGRDDPTGSR